MPIPAITFTLLTSKSVRRWALRRRRSSALSPFYRDLGWEGTATWRTWPGVSSLFLQAVPASYPVLGRGVDEDGGCGEENVDLPGSQDLSERGLRGGGGGR